MQSIQPSPIRTELRARYSSALTLANSVLISSSIGSVVWCIYAVINQKSHLSVRVAPAILVGIMALLLLRFQPAVRLLAVSVLVGGCVGIYSSQLLALVLIDPERPTLQAMQEEARKANVAFDGRTRIEVISELRGQGIAAYPPFYPYQVLESPPVIDGQPTIPLGSVAHARTVCCNEGGQYFSYTTDEHGFVNPPGSWSDIPADIAIIGASAAVGECVPAADSLLSQLRTRYPKTVSLGAGGNGPVLELASIREYLPVLKPKRVLWIFAESHTADYLETETHSPLLLRYLEKSHRQGLFEKQDALNQAVSSYFENGLAAEQAERAWVKQARDFLTLKSFRYMMYFYVTAQTAKPKSFQFNTALYEQVIREGQSNVADWGGKVTIVYWPDSSRYVGICNYTPRLRQLYDRTHDAVLNIAAKLGVSVIDLSRSFPDLPNRSEENTQYFYPYPAHYKPAGYCRAAKSILSSLERQP